ncbi:MAG TPA: flagellar basal body P-ring protein FlgI [Candidatus Hydrogenedentes bacterium]|nr:flagellar basal body P-ring protein FlgI [Candidatus Hydrogenedentota bacterium]HNT86325.1 flagellar basal body P-ring protein FlgI [Candidatus Hydrogenedentota bacterium]
MAWRSTKLRRLIAGVAGTALLLAVGAAHAAKLRDLCEIQGAQQNLLKGVGVVVGLAGTGDKAPIAVKSQERILERLGIDVQDLKQLKSDNIAVVMVTTYLPPFAKQGTRLDVQVASLHDAKSLEGGTLLETHLRGPGDSEAVYAVAQGAVSVGGFNADAGGTSLRKNHVTAGRIPMGAVVEREVPATITDGERLILILKDPDFIRANTIQQLICGKYGPDAAQAYGAGTVRVTIPEAERANLVAFIAALQDTEVPTQAPTRVVINERTGTIVVGGNVMIKPCQVAHGGLTIKIAATPIIAQPLPFTDAAAIETTMFDMEAEEIEAHLMPVEGTSAGEVAEALNKLKVTPRDMISIFQALREAGALEADLETM